MSASRNLTAGRRFAGHLRSLALLSTFIALSSAWADEPRLDQRVQAPTLAPPQRGSLAGELSSYQIDATELERGAPTLPLPIHFPEDRGRLILPIAPHYSTTQGLTEWGLGIAADLSITRFRRQGSLNYVDDEFTSPWGILKPGSDGNYYTAGLKGNVRLKLDSRNRWTAFLPNGDRIVFGGMQATIDNPQMHGTYAWLVTEASSVKGELSRYEWSRSGHPENSPLLQKVSYGGRGESFQYAIGFTYEDLTQRFLDYRSGALQALSARVKSIEISVRAGGQFQLRYAYELEHAKNEFGPGFHLKSITRRYASGVQEPPFQLEYATFESASRTARWKDLPSFDPVIKKLPNALLPEYSTLFSPNDDGLVHLEVANRLSTIDAQGDGTFKITEPLPEPARVNRACRPPRGLDQPFPRLIGHPRGANTQLEIIAFEHRSPMGDPIGNTLVSVCDLQGSTLAQTTLERDWTLSSTVRWFDLNGDSKPDLIQVEPGPTDVYGSTIRVTILENDSTPDNISFKPPRKVTLSGYLSSTSSVFFQDINGDGLADLVSSQSDGINVWYGKGGFEFERNPVFIPFKLGRFPITDLDRERVQFADLNGDGLPDALVQTEHSTEIFINDGKQFVLMDVGSIKSVAWQNFSTPIVANLSGSGNTQIVANDLFGRHVKVIEITRPETGLLQQVNDGKGNQIRYHYERAAPEPGVGHRFPVVSQLELSVAGEGTSITRYLYSSPAVHSLDRGFLGFEQIQSTSRTQQQNVLYHYADGQPGIVLSESKFDPRQADLIQTTDYQYEQAKDFGIDWSKLVATKTSFHAANSVSSRGSIGKNEELIENLKFERGVCPSHVRVTNGHGSIEYISQFSSPSLLSDSMHCMPQKISAQATHADSAFDFSSAVEVERNDAGQPRTISQESGSKRVLQIVNYNPAFDIESIESPGKGIITFGYDSDSGLLTSIQQPDGVNIVAVRDPLHDQISSIQEAHGAGAALTRHFEYDSFQRLEKSFGLFDGDSRQHFYAETRYRFATSELPGVIEELKKIEDGHTSALRHEAELFSGAGTSLGKLLHFTNTSVVSGLLSKDRDMLSQKSFAPRTADFEQDLKSLNFSALYPSEASVSESIESPWGDTLFSSQTYESDAIGKKQLTLSAESDGIVKRLLENNEFSWVTKTDTRKKIVSKELPEGQTYSYEYDVLRRIVRITLPGGAKHEVRYNGFGDVESIQRSDVGTLHYLYAPQTGILARKEWTGIDGKPQRSAQYEHDTIGRARAVVYKNEQTGQAEEHRYYYDGVLSDSSTVPGQLGRLSEVSGPGYRKLKIYRADGKEVSEKVIIPQFGGAQIDYSYRTDGEVQERIIRRLDSDGRALSSSKLTFPIDDSGREIGLILNGASLLSFQYDELSRLSDISSNETHFHREFDPVTGEASGYSQTYPRANGKYFTHWNKNDRGLLGAESFQSSSESLNGKYFYNKSGFLSDASDERSSSGYLYLPDGSLESVKTDKGSEAFSFTRDKWKSGEDSYVLDASGRVSYRDLSGDKRVMQYGPQGRLSKLTQVPLLPLSYEYDDAGIRIAKRRGDRIEEAYLGDILLNEKTLLIRVKVEDQVVGYIEDQTFKPISVDFKNAVVSDDGSVLNVPESFGDRGKNAGQPGNLRSHLIDYSMVGYDPDLGAYRMGLRDYDPRIKRFLTPDPLFFEHPENCIDSPVECNLYSYAKNAPHTYVDPSGQGAASIALGFVTAKALAIYGAYYGAKIATNLATKGDENARASAAQDLNTGFKVVTAVNAPQIKLFSAFLSPGMQALVWSLELKTGRDITQIEVSKSGTIGPAAVSRETFIKDTVFFAAGMKMNAIEHFGIKGLDKELHEQFEAGKSLIEGVAKTRDAAELTQTTRESLEKIEANVHSQDRP